MPPKVYSKYVSKCPQVCSKTAPNKAQNLALNATDQSYQETSVVFFNYVLKVFQLYCSKIFKVYFKKVWFRSGSFFYTMICEECKCSKYPLETSSIFTNNIFFQIFQENCSIIGIKKNCISASVQRSVTGFQMLPQVCNKSYYRYEVLSSRICLSQV